MSVSDPISDMLTRIRNASVAKHPAVSMPSSREKTALADVLRQCGYINGFKVEGEIQKTLTLDLKYDGKTPVIEGLKRVSAPSCRIYVSCDDIPRVMGGMGIAVLSTSRGIMSDRKARQQRLGGELLCYVW
ncbi:MAG: 30S ribosomal protein S8 [Lentisphaeria bacterium]|jgi:small subunit ribosomal protein S8